MPNDLQTASSRARLAPRGKPYKTSLARGLTLGYRRHANGTPGAWVVIGSDGNGGQWSDAFAKADDTGSVADGVQIITYAQAARRAVELAHGRGNVAAAALPLTIDEALTRYEHDLSARGQNVGNARYVRSKLPPHLLPTLLSTVTARQFADWRDQLLVGGMKPATLNRLLKPTRAAFNLASKTDDRIAANVGAWTNGLEMIRGADTARKAILTDSKVKELVARAYDLADDFGLYVQAHAELGSRTDQISRITVGDLVGNRVMVPNSGKGRGKHKAECGSTSVPIGASLASRFTVAAVGHPADAPLLVQADGRPWMDGGRERSLAAKLFAAEDVSMIAFRHSSIVRALRANVPVKVVADWHNTSIAMIEKHYARYMRDTHDDLIRAALMDTTPNANIVPLCA